MVRDFPRLRILLLQGERPVWRESRQWSYDMHLGWEEGMAANDISVTTLTTTWLDYALELCAGKTFDQVWINDAAHLGRNETITPKGWEWLAGLAPVRLGFIIETVQDSPGEEKIVSLKEYHRNLKTNLPYLTHLAAVDEKDAANLSVQWNIPAIWLPVSVPQRFIAEFPPAPFIHKAVFSGSVYGTRKGFLEDPTLIDLLTHIISPENKTLLPSLFNVLPKHRLEQRIDQYINRLANPRLPQLDAETLNTRYPFKFVYPLYLKALRTIRQKSYASYLQGLQTGCAVVNLPSHFRGYAGRVAESMAAGRPVISWRIPDRPLVNTLFTDDQEILLFDKDKPAQLADQIRRILAEPDLSQRIVTNARRKLRQFHTNEYRVKQILDWIVTGKQPVYH